MEGARREEKRDEKLTHCDPTGNQIALVYDQDDLFM